MHSFREQRSTLIYCMAIIEVAVTFVVTDAAAVAWAAGAMSGAQIAAWGVSYFFIAFGVLFTSYELTQSRPSNVVPITTARRQGGKGTKAHRRAANGYLTGP